MMTKTSIGSRACYIYEYGALQAILIQPVDDHDLEVLDSEVDHIARLAEGKGFILVAFKIDDWNSELAPWAAPAVFGDESFGSGARETLDYVTKTLLPEVSHGHDLPVYIGGYSLAGFFSLWAAYQTDVFAGVAAASPSVWFPGWIDYAGENSIKAEKVYLSLGDKEEKTRNPVMKTVGDNIRKQIEILERDPSCRDCVLEMNQGNHFKEPDLRTAKGFVWLLRDMSSLLEEFCTVKDEDASDRKGAF